MAELPEDAPRLRLILAHVERQIAENETINTYLSLQLAAVRQALARAEQRARPQHPTRRAKGAGGPLPAPFARPARTGEYAVQRARSADDPNPPVIHLATCERIAEPSRRVRADEARAALTDPAFEPCLKCRPETQLGIDLA